MERSNSIYKENSLKNSILSNIIEESRSFNNISNIFNQIYNKKNNNRTQINFNKDNNIKRKVMVSLLKAMDRNTHMNLNNINSLNFVCQAFGKGMNIINNEKNKNLNRTQNIINCLRKNRFYTNIYPNENIRSFSYNNENNKISPYKATNKNFFKKKSNEQKLILKNNDIKKYVARSTSCYIKNIRRSNQRENFILLPIKNVLIKKTLENYNNVPHIEKEREEKKERKSIIFKKKKLIEEEKEKELRENLKVFSVKYEKEKEDFNNILFDECIDLRKKKFKLESFIKKFTNNHFVEKLYKIKELALQKSTKT